MTIDKQALREAAEKATRGPWEMERENIWFTDEDGYTKHLAYVQQGDDVDDKQDHYNTAFIAVANPATMLALLDENLQLQREKDAIEAVALALRDDMRQAREQLEAGWKQNATDVQIKARLCRESNSLHDRLREAEKRIAELKARKVMLPDRKSEIFWPGDAAEFDILGYVIAVKSAIRAAGIKVKES
ncbi:ead/Ea22-like family protein [Salmonella enterica]|nr:ead/Ea22-like family protein [Salmonella enterica subsp. enterica]EJJ4342089.1 ead/Ea22-like family protein [Salmonella enterica]EMD4714249.1 ead/Ea22-like family protein [Salmonella enterica]